MSALRTQLRAAAGVRSVAVPRPLSASRGSIRVRASDNNEVPSSAPAPELQPITASASTSGQSVQDFKILNPVTESINGRAAMLGLVAALISELATNQSVWSQVAGRYADLDMVEKPIGVSVLGFGMVVALITVASLAPKMLAGENANSRSFGPFTPTAELINGRVAQLGFLALIIVEAVRGSALF